MLTFQGIRLLLSWNIDCKLKRVLLFEDFGNSLLSYANCIKSRWILPSKRIEERNFTEIAGMGPVGRMLQLEGLIPL